MQLWHWTVGFNHLPVVSLSPECPMAFPSFPRWSSLYWITFGIWEDEVVLTVVVLLVVGSVVVTVVVLVVVVLAVVVVVSSCSSSVMTSGMSVDCVVVCCCVVLGGAAVALNISLSVAKSKSNKELLNDNWGLVILVSATATYGGRSVRAWWSVLVIFGVSARKLLSSSSRQVDILQATSPKLVSSLEMLKESVKRSDMAVVLAEDRLESWLRPACSVFSVDATESVIAETFVLVTGLVGITEMAMR